MSATSSPTGLVLGIDTGGTYTDAVLLDYATRRVLAAHKSLTTRRDLALGIEAVIAGIRLDDPARVKMVSVSTTLATNAIAEGKSRPVGLLLIGYDAELVAKFRLDRRFGTPRFAYIDGGHDLYGREQAPLDLDALRAQVAALAPEVDALAVSAYFSPLNPEHELRALAAIRDTCDLPVVLGHQLSSKLGSVERATTAALNASLLAVLEAFVAAVRRSLARRQIDAPLMVVRGDGTLMSAGFAAHVPVETIHSGPAASAVGGRFLSRLDDALVIDVGGTTTDIALVQGGQVAVSREGATVNGYKTAVQAANLLSIPLGGDSHIQQSRERQLQIGPERVVPLAHLAAQFPEVNGQLQTLARRVASRATPDWLQFWFLQREPADGAVLDTPHAQALVRLLRRGPLPLPDVLAQLKLLHAGQIDAGSLFRREIIGRAGLTPTDLLHVEGRYAPWDAGASALALDLFYKFLFSSQEALQAAVWRQMTESIVRAVVLFLSEKQFAPPAQPRDADLGRWFFENSLTETHPHLATEIRLRHPIIGIGAPADMLLPAVAERLHTELILPRHHAVANAVGAVAGSIVMTEEVLVLPRLSKAGLEVLGYTVQSRNGRSDVDDLPRALHQARTVGEALVRGAAEQAGASGLQLLVDEIADGLDTVRVRVRAIGAPRLGD